VDPIGSVGVRMAEIQARIASIRAAGAGVRAIGTTPTGQTFATMYANAVASTRETHGHEHAHGVSGTLNAEGVPAELAAYGNGKIPETALSSVGTGGHKLWAPAAESMNSMLAAARRDGVTIGITDSYRPYAEQVDLARRKGLYSQGGLAAKPGTSDHGWGRAVDLDLDARAQSWMRANGPKFGFIEDTPREPWHWAYSPPAQRVAV
jgi:D-alanyl-D-alanine carboxypeptidase